MKRDDSFGGKHLNIYFVYKFVVSSEEVSCHKGGNQGRPLSEYVLNILMGGEGETKRKRERDVKKEGKEL
jgi:hypothetical protein